MAAVLAHEIAQLQYKDPRLSMARKILTGVTQTGAAVGPAFGPIGALAVLGLVLVHAAVDSNGKTPEERLGDADERALHYLVAAGYDPQASVEVIYKFLRADKQMVPYFYDYYQSRPISDVRVSHLERAFAKLDLGDKELLTRHQTYQEMTKGIREIYKQ
jgi:predicted Zn-dependent protease